MGKTYWDGEETWFGRLGDAMRMVMPSTTLPVDLKVIKCYTVLLSQRFICHSATLTTFGFVLVVSKS